MSTPAVLMATAKIRPGSEDAFATWRTRHDAAVAKFPGFRSSDVMPPGDGDGTWTFVLNFDSQDHLAAWQQSTERAAIVGELVPLTVGGNFGEVMPSASPDAAAAGTAVTQIIFSRIKPGMEENYRNWATRIQRAEERFAGYRGTYFQPPGAGGTQWITMVRFDSAEHLNAWIAAPERAALIEEARAYVESDELVRLATSFPGWVPIKPEAGKGPPDWKPALLVLLGLYPIVALELNYLNPVLASLPPAVGVFLGNVLSVALTSFITIPLFIHLFHDWLFAEATQNTRANWLGSSILAAIFAAEIVVMHLFLPWKLG
jgi:antibiotic biosynthesis monooxygenase (ABM) superfamily enzyme